MHSSEYSIQVFLVKVFFCVCVFYNSSDCTLRIYFRAALLFSDPIWHIFLSGEHTKYCGSIYIVVVTSYCSRYSDTITD